MEGQLKYVHTMPCRDPWGASYMGMWHLGEGITKIGLFPGHRNWMPRCSVKTTAFKQNRHIKTQTNKPDR